MAQLGIGMISVVLAVHNEAENLARSLDSVKKWADEIVVVDGESTDETVSIARRYGARVIKTTNKRNFHINKQMGNDAAKGDLILQLDADEVVDAELATFIVKVAQNLEATTDSAWWIKRKNFFMGRWLSKGGQYPDAVIRLFKAGQAELPQKDVHEQMVVNGSTGWAEGHLLHYSNPTFADYLRKFNTYTTFKAYQLKDQKLKIALPSVLRFWVWLPLATFVSMYLRHKGFVDGFPGFVFAVMSGLHHPVAFLKYWELKLPKKNV